MAARDDRQNFFDFDAVAEAPKPAVSPRMTYREALVEQIVRDAKVLDEDPCYHVPSEEFFIDRIIAYKAEVDRLDKSAKEQ